MILLACLNWPLAVVIVAAIAGACYFLRDFRFEVEFKDPDE